MKFPAVIQKLIEELCAWPSVGPKTAERYVFWLIQQSPERLKFLAEQLASLPQIITKCQSCRALTSSNPCEVCADATRCQDQLCLIANTRDLAAVENLGQYRGRYFVLGQKMDVINAVGPASEDLRLLLNQITGRNITEVILALDPDLTGETTALYLQKILKKYKLKISRLAQGLPSGTTLEYADQQTLSQAFNHRYFL